MNICLKRCAIDGIPSTRSCARGRERTLIQNCFHCKRSTQPLPSYNSAFFSGHLTQAKSTSLFCRKLRLIFHPTSCQLKRHNFLEIMQCLEHFLQGHLLLRPALPRRSVQCPNYQVIVANDFWHLLGEKGCKKLFYIVLMRNEQVTAGAVAARLVQRQH